MDRRSRVDPRPQASPRVAAGRRGRPGLHLGRVRITPIRVALAIAFLGGVAFLAYATIVRDQLQVPLMASGFAIMGMVFAAFAVAGVIGVVQAGREGRDAAAVGAALFGGLSSIAALLFLAAAVVFGLIWSSTD
jgi:hypothetical protein